MNIKQIIPASGWSTVECKIYNQDGTDEIVKYESSPLVGGLWLKTTVIARFKL